jgi:hypothetical protein
MDAHLQDSFVLRETTRKNEQRGGKARSRTGAGWRAIL